MKTLTAFLHLLFPAGRKNSRAVNNDQTSEKGCSTATTVENQSKHMNDAKQYDVSFLFFNQAESQQSGVGSSQSANSDEKLKSKEESKKINDELALGSSPNPLYKNRREKVNDDLAACVTVDRESAVVIPMVIGSESVIASRESVTVINELKNIFPTTVANDKTRTNKNGAWLPFASFSFIRRIVRRDFNEGESFSVGGFRRLVRRNFFSLDESFKNQKPVLLAIPIRSRQTGKPNYTDRIKL